jgi:hypothetical protein
LPFHGVSRILFTGSVVQPSNLSFLSKKQRQENSAHQTESYSQCRFRS